MTVRSRGKASRLLLAGVVAGLRIRPFRSGDGRMAIINFEDHTGTVEVIAMGDDFDRHEALLTSDQPVLLTGKLRLEFDEGQAKISVRLGNGGRRGSAESKEIAVSALVDVRAQRARGWQVELPAGDVTRPRLEQLKKLLEAAPDEGGCDAFLKLVTADKCEVMLSLPGVKVVPNDELHDKVERLMGPTCTVRTL